MRFNIHRSDVHRLEFADFAEKYNTPKLAEWLRMDPKHTLDMTSNQMGRRFAHLGVMCGAYHGSAVHVCDNSKGDFDEKDSDETALPPRLKICDRCLRAIGVDTRQEETAVEWSLKNETKPWKVLDLLNAPDMWDEDVRRVWNLWYHLTIAAGEWSEDWSTYTQPDYAIGIERKKRLIDRSNYTYLDAGWTNPWRFANDILGWYTPAKDRRGQPEATRMLKDWSGPSRVAFARRFERLLWLMGAGPPTPEQVASKAEVCRQILKLRDKRWVILDKLDRYKTEDHETPFSPQDDRDNPLFADLKSKGGE
jgi:hypothetical protein